MIPSLGSDNARVMMELKLKQFLCLHESYQDLILIKKISKAFQQLDESPELLRQASDFKKHFALGGERLGTIEEEW